ncbi:MULTISPECIES: Lrp/AsnC family transcriptional regulator [Halobacterium]|uniref:Transcription regulator n=4 Tax=Halobacterium salinarum TaxID=2242 RepID=Q9HP41_HALSA|nr:MULTISPECIES: Lrp/AsnC family transcriptional regulator [Halobacterium]AAG20029.1 transcription regulator [Halobacterium salinarum NRC-1]MBB6089038.1 DNA-binding Lrp family transcriptional regulator [Halobacterium salinarum]MCF2164741.1 Lrp/AsnC family transcriptional regulator [Halobacterium salinarum]MCF2167580.1 Lrp/AsnC family transcriptional regulator [Halobacterium salinarum]MCF2207065.1 Lrp/AsnC family transcriptional regulator [Halobacterium salinarum]
MDDIDQQILDTLRRDARTPYTEIADDIGVSEGTIRNRVDQLVDDGVIERFTVSTSTGNVKAMIEIGVAMDADTHVVGDRMVEWDAVDFVWQVSGEDDIVLIVDAADTSGVNDLMRRAREQDVVVSTRTRLILDEKLG